MQNNVELRKQAKELLDNGKLNQACEIYTQIYKADSDKWIGWEYATALKKSQKIDAAICISKQVYESHKNFEYNCNLLSWLVYEKYFKNLKEEYDYIEISKLLKISFSITDFAQHNDKSGLEKIVFKMIKILKMSNTPRYSEILNLLENLNVDLLSSNPGKFEQRGQEKEYQSPKETYYSIKTKALYETDNFEDCIRCCDEFEKNINNSHHDNIYWILSRKANSLAKLGNIDDAIHLLNDIVLKKHHWSLFDTLAKIYLLKNDTPSALLYFCRAAMTIDSPKMKVGLYVDIAKLLIQNGEIERAVSHLLFSKQIRDHEEWKTTKDLTELLNVYSTENSEIKITLNELKVFWCESIYSTLGKYHGTITQINKYGKNGFIKTDKGSYFFKTSSFIYKDIPKVGMPIIATLIDSYDAKKNTQTLEYAYIKFDKK